MKLPATLDLGKLLEDNAYAGGTKMLFRRTMRAPIVNGEVTLEPCWIAEVFTRPNMRRPLIQIVDAEVAGLFAQLAMLSKEGEVTISIGDDEGEVKVSLDDDEDA